VSPLGLLPACIPGLYRCDRRLRLTDIGDGMQERETTAFEKMFTRRLANFFLSGLFRI
jgi:hypothetical protein